jgi:trimeric autotransporter adhesin
LEKRHGAQRTFFVDIPSTLRGHVSNFLSMNKSHQTIWNESLGAWVATSERAAACGKKARNRRVSATAGTAVTVALLWGFGTPQEALAQSVCETNGSNTLIGSATGLNALACGVGAQATVESAVAIGTGAVADQTPGVPTGTGSVAIGQNAKAGAGTTNNTGVAIGKDASAIQGGLAIGELALSQAGGVALGPGARASAAANVAIGSQAIAMGISAVAIGSNAGGSTGGLAGALGTYIGYSAGRNSTGGRNTYLGADAGNTTTGSNNLYSGVSAGFGVTGSNNVALGAQATRLLTVSNIVSVGASSSAQANDATALGQNAQATEVNSVALGANSTTTAAVPTASGTINGTVYTYAGAVPDGVVSVGSAGKERQVQNVAAGQVSATSTDAINGSQLFATNTAIENLTTTTAANKTKFVSIDAPAGIAGAGTNADNDGATVGSGGMAIGVAATATSQFALALGNNAAVSGQYSIAMGTSATASGDYSTALGTLSSVTAQFGTAVGNGSTATENGTALGAQATATALNATAIGMAAQATEIHSVALGARSETRAATPTAGVTINGTAYTFAGTVPAGVVSVGSVGQERQIQNVAAGQISATSTDAINGSQLFATNTAIQNLATSVSTLGAAKYVSINSTGGNNEDNKGATGADAIAIGKNTTAAGTDSVAVGRGASAGNANSIALGADSSTTRGAEAGYNAAYVGASNSTGEMNVGGRTITGVAPGRAATDAVNVQQLQSGIADAYAYTDARVNAVDNRVTSVDNRVTNIDGRVTKVEGEVKGLRGDVDTLQGRAKSVQEGHEGAFQVSKDVTASPKPLGTNSAAGGTNALASGNNSLAVGNDTNAIGTNSTALGQGATVTASAANSVALGSNSQASRGGSDAYTAIGVGAGQKSAGEVSVGAAGAERQITNVAPGKEGTDAVNVNQLAGVAKELGARLDGQAKDARAGSSAAMAMAAMPQAYIPGKSMLTAGAGTYAGQTALALGFTRMSDNGLWVSKLAGSVDSRGKVGFSVGFGVHW